MHGPEKKSLEREESGRERIILRVINGLIFLLALTVYFGLSLVMAAMLTSACLLPNYFLSVLVSSVLLAPLALLMLRACFARGSVSGLRARFIF